MEILTGILTLLAGCGVFMIGMKMMSDGLESSAGPGMRRLFNRISGNRFSAVGVGAVVTGIIQSSTATTVMTIGLVNAGILSLLQAASIVMGANIGTTVTGLIVALSSSSFSITWYVATLALIGVIMMMFFKNSVIKTIGGVLAGLGLIFIGLDLMSGALMVDELKGFFQKMFTTINFPLLLILFGIVFAALVHSSSATTGIVITLAGVGALTIGDAFFIVLGTNIGTTITAMMASAGASTNAKRTALFHTLFNVMGTFVFGVIVWVWNAPIVKLFSTIAPVAELQIALFHICFNVLTTAMMMPFLKPFVRLIERMIPDKPETEPEAFKMKFIDDRMLQTPPIALAQVHKEIVDMAEMAKENLRLATDVLFTGNFAEKDTIRNAEKAINHKNYSIAKFLIKLSSLSTSDNDEIKIGSYHHVINDIERIGDHAENFLEQAEKMDAQSIRFSSDATEELVRMYTHLSEMFVLSIDAFSHRKFTSLERLSAMEEEVDAMKNELGFKHIERLNAGECAVERGSYFFAVTSALERIGDHLVNIGYSIKNPTGSQNGLAAKKTRTPVKAASGGKTKKG